VRLAATFDPVRSKGVDPTQPAAPESARLRRVGGMLCGAWPSRSSVFRSALDAE
jgi:hypothetical protein